MAYYVYLVKCSDGSLYCGYTTNIKDRIREHNDSKYGAKYTRGRRPVKLVYSENFSTQSTAMKREAQIKKLTKKQKEELLRDKDL